MIVIGLDVHKHSLTAVAVDELGRERGAWSGPIGVGAVQWAQSFEAERLWAIEDCRHVTRALEQTAGVAPLDASSGKHQRHRLDRGGNRQLNCALHRIAVTQGRVHAPARAYLERKQSEGKNRREAIRCLKRQLARTIYSTLKAEPALT
jgi:transposase